MASGLEKEITSTIRVFVNAVDLYHGKHIANYLSNCVVGASLEELEDDDDGNSVDSDFVPKPKEDCFEIVGTLRDKNSKKPDFVKEIIQYETKEQLYEQMVECDIFIYDITEDPKQIDEAIWSVSELHADFERIEKQKMFILISTIMTWARSKVLDPDDPEIPFTEEDYRRRKPHPNFKEHLSTEKTVIKLGKTNKSKLVTFVVATGLTYGFGEHILHYLFKSAWHNADQLQCFGSGNNVIPMIHVKDLAGIVQNICDSKPKVRYLVAVDDSKNTLEEVVKSVSQTLGTGKVKNISKEEALLSRDIEQADFDHLLVNLRMDAVYVKENMRIKWTAETGIVENITSVVKEYKHNRGLLPMRAAILGPPAVGKTLLAKKLSEHYKLHHIKIKDLIDESLEKLQISAARAEDEDNEDDDGKAQEDAELLEQINESRESSSSSRLEDSFVIRFFRAKLLSTSCQNQGFILDGYPKTTEQARQLFSLSEEDEEEGKPNYDSTIMPETVISLEADDNFLRDRVMNLPENVVAGTHNTEEGLTRRLAEFRSLNQEDETVLNYFDELEIHPVKIDVTKDDTEELAQTLESVMKILGSPRNYGLTPEEQAEKNRIAEEERIQKKAEAQALLERQEAEEAAERKRRQKEWEAQLEEVKREEYDLLETQSIPLRNYLMKHVMPTLTQGLMDSCKVRPDDAIDYLAEYLFKNNPQM